LRVVIFRFANVVGSRARHGVIYDFMKKLRKNSNELEVLGDGTQTKSYLHVSDCVDAFLMCLDEQLWSKAVKIYNIGSDEQTDVLTIARIVTETMGLKNVKIRTTAGPGGKAWPGDVGKMQLDISKIKMSGWRPKLGSDGAVRLAVKELIQELK
jgi:UDP-glucose 4-epimerase